MLVGLVDGLVPRRGRQEQVDFAAEGLLETRLAEMTPEGIQATELGRQVRAAEPPSVEGAGRVWFGQDESSKARGD